MYNKDTAAKITKRALANIKKGFCQNTLYRDENGDSTTEHLEAESYCALGAIRAATCQEFHARNYSDLSPLQRELMFNIEMDLHEKTKTMEDYCNGAASWNDHWDTTKDDAVREFSLLHRRVMRRGAINFFNTPATDKYKIFNYTPEFKQEEGHNG